MSTRQQPQARSIAFLSSNEPWGGSEELWSRTALALASSGHDVSVYKRLSRPQPEVAALRKSDCRVIDLHDPAWAPRRVRSLIGSIWKVSRYLQERRLVREFGRRRPDLVVISQGLNYDGWYAGVTCRRLGVPYVMISQKASDLYWPSDAMRDELCAVYRDAVGAFFVSDHNRVLTQEQLGFALPNAKVVRNPFNADWHTTPNWPSESDGYRLACVARLDAREKGQDLLLRVLARPKWRARNLKVRLYGSGHNERGLRAMGAMLALENVEFRGFAEDSATIWADIHGLVLPSRCEGLPLSLIEAMLHGRVAIVTDVGGNREAVVDGTTGFLADAATEAALDAAMERAWQRRTEWRAMGEAGAAYARTLVGPDPALDLAALVLKLAEEHAADGTKGRQALGQSVSQSG